MIRYILSTLFQAHPLNLDLHDLDNCIAQSALMHACMAWCIGELDCELPKCPLRIAVGTLAVGTLWQSQKSHSLTMMSQR